MRTLIDTSSPGTTAQQRSGSRPPAGRPGSRPAEDRDLYAVLVELARTRQSYEDLRIEGGPLWERADLASHLHELRAEAAALRQEA